MGTHLFGSPCTSVQGIPLTLKAFFYIKVCSFYTYSTLNKFNWVPYFKTMSWKNLSLGAWTVGTRFENSDKQPQLNPLRLRAAELVAN